MARSGFFVTDLAAMVRQVANDNALLPLPLQSLRERRFFKSYFTTLARCSIAADRVSAQENRVPIYSAARISARIYEIAVNIDHLSLQDAGEIDLTAPLPYDIPMPIDIDMSRPLHFLQRRSLKMMARHPYG